MSLRFFVHEVLQILGPRELFFPENGKFPDFFSRDLFFGTPKTCLFSISEPSLKLPFFGFPGLLPSKPVFSGFYISKGLFNYKINDL